MSEEISLTRGKGLRKRMLVANSPRVQKNNEIWYTTTDGNAITSKAFSSNNTLLYNIYTVVNGQKMGILKFANSLRNLAFQAFYNYTTLETVHLPNNSNFTDLNEETFRGCSNLKSVNIPDHIAAIRYATFWGCNNLTTIVIPDSVRSIAKYAFLSCTKLSSITIGNGVTSTTGTNVFGGCTNLKSVYISNLAAFCGISFYNHNYSAPFVYYANLYLNNVKVTDLIVPDGITRISNNAFRNCTSITSVVLPDSITSIESYGFNTTALHSLVCKSITPPSVGGNFISNNIVAIYVPSESVESYKQASGWSSYASKIQAYTPS